MTCQRDYPFLGLLVVLRLCVHPHVTLSGCLASFCQIFCLFLSTCLAEFVQEHGGGMDVESALVSVCLRALPKLLDFIGTNLNMLFK